MSNNLSVTEVPDEAREADGVPSGEGGLRRLYAAGRLQLVRKGKGHSEAL